MIFWKRQNYGDSKKISSCQEMGSVRDEMVEHRCLGQWKYSVWHYNDGHMSLYICPKTKNVQPQERTLMQTMDSEWLCCVSVGSSVVTDVPLWWGMLLMGEAVHMWVQEAYGKSQYLPLNCEPETALWNLKEKIKYTLKLQINRKQLESTNDGDNKLKKMYHCKISSYVCTKYCTCALLLKL